MASQRESPVLFSRRLDKTERQLDLLLDLARSTNEAVQSLRPQHDLPAIPRPKQKRDFNRSCNVVDWLRAEIDRRNVSLPEGSSKYRQFPEDTEDTRISSDAQRCLEILAMFHLDTEYGTCTWDQAMIRKPRECAAILREARQTPELSVFCQTAGLWGIDMLLKSKMKSKLRTLGRVDDTDENGTAALHPANEEQNTGSIVMNTARNGSERNGGQINNMGQTSITHRNPAILNQPNTQQGAQNQMPNPVTEMLAPVVNFGISGDPSLLSSPMQGASSSPYTHRSPFQQQSIAPTPDSLHTTMHQLRSVDQANDNLPSNRVQNIAGHTHSAVQNSIAEGGSHGLLEIEEVESSVNNSIVRGYRGRGSRGRVSRGRGARGRGARAGVRRRTRARRA